MSFSPTCRRRRTRPRSAGARRFHGRARRCVDVSYAGNRGRGGMTGPVAGIRRRRTVAGRRETSHLPPDRAFYGQTLATDILVVGAYALIESESTWEKTTRACIHFTAMRNLIMLFVKSYPYDATFPHSRSRPVEWSFSKATRTSSGT